MRKIDYLLYDALSAAAIIRYRRCFKKAARRKPLSNDIVNQLPPELLEIHNFIIDLRDKHIAHSENPYEENIVTLQIADQYVASQEIESINTDHGQVIGAPTDLINPIMRLAKWWLVWLRKESKKEKQFLLVLARSKPLEELKKDEQGVLVVRWISFTAGSLSTLNA